MCGRFTLQASPEAIAEHFSLPEVPDLLPRYNVAPTQMVPAVKLTPNGRALSMLKWGLVPSWAEDPSVGSRMINARAETVAEKPAFRSAFKQRRCLLPVDGFFEWKAEGKVKQPWYFRLPSRSSGRVRPKFDVKPLRSSLRRRQGIPTDPPSTRTDPIAPAYSSTPVSSAPPPHHPPSTSSPSHTAAA